MLTVFWLILLWMQFAATLRFSLRWLTERTMAAVLFGAIGDANPHYGEVSPIQIGQFEGEAHLMDKWLTAIHLEGAGGPYGQESYEYAFYAAARHTSCDCFEKRGKKVLHK